MSDSLAIAAITATLRDLLQLGLNAENATVITRPPDKVQANASRNHVNLFLYHATVDPHWRNMDVPWKVKPGETGHTPLPLNLYYLITAYYGESEDGVDTITDQNRLLGSHRLLGRAMSVLHDHPLLDTDAINASLPGSDRSEHPYDQVERIRITPHILSLDELSKVWTGFQTQYRLSAAYQVSVVLIESSRATRTPLPVLTQGQDDSGPTAQANLLPPFPTLTEIRFPNQQPGIRQGETMVLVGHHLTANQITAHCINRRLDLPYELVVPPGTATELSVTLPDEPTQWPSGHYVIEAALKGDEEDVHATNALMFALVPAIAVEEKNQTAPDADGRTTVTFKITCKPQIRHEQQVALLWGDREILPHEVNTPHDNANPPQPLPQVPTTLIFQIDAVEPGDYWVRLRVDGVDSLLIDWTKTPPQFDENYKVTVT